MSIHLTPNFPYTYPPVDFPTVVVSPPVAISPRNVTSFVPISNREAASNWEVIPRLNTLLNNFMEMHSFIPQREETLPVYQQTPEPLMEVVVEQQSVTPIDPFSGLASTLIRHLRDRHITAFQEELRQHASLMTGANMRSLINRSLATPDIVNLLLSKLWKMFKVEFQNNTYFILHTLIKNQIVVNDSELLSAFGDEMASLQSQELETLLNLVAMKGYQCPALEEMLKLALVC